MKKRFQIILLFLMVLILAGCSDQKTKVLVPNGDSNFSKRSHYGNYISNEKELQHFIENKMMTKKGIYTNYKKQSYKKNVARGHELLSESSGMWLEYLIYTHQYKKFREFYRETKKTFDQGSQFSYRYTPATNKKFDVNATLDDLRIIRALQMYADQTGNKNYKKEAARRFGSLQKNTMSNGKIASFYDVKTKKASDDGSLAYYDFSTLKYFESTSKQNKKMYKKQLAVVQNGYLGDAFPLYASSYNWSNKTYSNNDLNTSEALETLLHLSEIGKLKQVSLNWLKNQVDRNTLYNGYSVNGNVVSRSHSAGSYALAAMIFAKQGNKRMYQKAMKLTWKYQMKNEKSAIYGGIGIEHQNEAYSYNNLTTLLAAKY
ncbi:hypothetical protein CPR19092_LGOLGGFK_00845 [Companilactobacillus paralimentarius]|uniref:hypothetical protein n=1 Tax=Companilactobacillus paralimentarius TaxID=83526 RepID=UPI00384F4F0E